MEKINLLPEEILLQRRQNSKLSLVNNIAFGVLIIMIIATSVVLALRFSQNNQLGEVQTALVNAENRVKGLQPKESQLVALKSRVTSIQGLSGVDQKRKDIFNMMVALTPEQVKVVEINVDKIGNISVTLTSSDLNGIEKLITDLVDQEKTASLANMIALEGLSMSKDGVFLFNMKISAK